MSKAEKMFNELGFEKIVLEENRYISRIKYRKTVMVKDRNKSVEDEIDYILEVQFNGIVFEYMYSYIDTLGHHHVYPMSLKEHQAITQQMKELGWLE